MVRFRSVIKIIGVNPYVTVTATQAKKLKEGWKKPLPVRVRINGKPKKAWRINLMPKGDGSFYLYLHGNVRSASGTGIGDNVEIEVEFDDAYRNGPMHPMPSWFRDALNGNDAAKRLWRKLPPSRKKEVLRYFANLKSEAAQQRNLERAMNVLSGSEERFMGRSWANGA